MNENKRGAVAMDLGFRKSAYQLVTDIKIPDVYYRRFKTGIDQLDELFGEGFLPGSTFTIDAAPGTGKTTLMLQMLDRFSQNGKRVAYVSGEEDVVQIAFTCKRLGVVHVVMANKTDVDEIVTDIEENKFDVVILDSFQCMKTEQVDTPKATEEYVVNRMCKAAKDNECVVGFIMHRTKAGKLKGGSVVPHTVDMNIALDRGDEEVYGTDQVRILSIYKNRFGSTGETEFEMGPNGYNFEVKINVPTSDSSSKKAKSSMGKDREVTELLNAAENRLTVGRATEITGNFYRGTNLIKEMVATGKLRKIGRGSDSYYVTTN